MATKKVLIVEDERPLAHALQLKLNELVAAHEFASSHLVNNRKLFIIIIGFYFSFWKILSFISNIL